MGRNAGKDVVGCCRDGIQRLESESSATALKKVVESLPHVDSMTLRSIAIAISFAGRVACTLKGHSVLWQQPLTTKVCCVRKDGLRLCDTSDETDLVRVMEGDEVVSRG